MRAPSTLLELESPPIDLQPISFTVELFKLDEQLTRLVFGFNDTNTRHDDRSSQRRY